MQALEDALKGRLKKLGKSNRNREGFSCTRNGESGDQRATARHRLESLLPLETFGVKVGIWTEVAPPGSMASKALACHGTVINQPCKGPAVMASLHLTIVATVAVHSIMVHGLSSPIFKSPIMSDAGDRSDGWCLLSICPSSISIYCILLLLFFSRPVTEPQRRRPS